MKHCHVCKTECEDNAELCPICGADLTEEYEENIEKSNDETVAEPVLVANFEDMVSAEIFRDILLENGIPYSCSDDAMRVTFGGGFVSQDIFVDASNYDEAQQLYNEFIETQPEFDGEFDDDFFEEEV